MRRSSNLALHGREIFLLRHFFYDKKVPEHIQYQIFFYILLSVAIAQCGSHPSSEKSHFALDGNEYRDLELMGVQRRSDGWSAQPQRKHIAPRPAPCNSGDIRKKGCKYCKSWRSGSIAVNQCFQVLGQPPNTQTHSGGIANTRPAQEKTSQNPSTDG